MPQTDTADQRSEPCRGCPWRTSNHGKRHPDGWYTAANRRRLWAGMRRGEDMSCHPTDSDNPVSDRAQDAGYRAAPDGAEVKECIGAHILRQREVMIFQDDYGCDIRAYRRARPKGLTREGLAAVVMRAAFGGAPLIGGRPLPKPNLNAVDVSHPDLGAWTPREEKP